MSRGSGVLARVAGLGLLVLLCFVPVGNAAVMDAGLPMGPYVVGFHREWTVDKSRIWDRGPNLEGQVGPVGRPLRVDVWFPTPGDEPCRRATLRDYLFAVPPDAYHELANDRVVDWDADSYRGYARSSGIAFDELMSLHTLACLDASEPVESHPLVIYSGGWYNRSPDNIALAEYLVSHGYVFAAVPILGDGLWTGDLTSNALAVETQVRDLEATLGALIRHQWVDRTRVASIGYSTGGIVALLLEGADPLIDAVVGLDPSYEPQPEKVLEIPYFGMYRNRSPILTLRSGDEGLSPMALSPVLSAMPFADRYVGVVRKGGHGDFSDDVVIEATLSLSRPGEERSTVEGIAAYRAVAAAVRDFLDGALAVRPDAMRSLTSPDRETLRIEKKEAAAIPTSEQWLSLLREGSAEELAGRAARLVERYPNVPVVIEARMNREGYRLMREGDTGVALEVMRFNAVTHPASANAYDSLADACQAASDDPCTIEAYRKLLQALPRDSALPPDVKERLRENAEKRLKELGVGDS